MRFGEPYMDREVSGTPKNSTRKWIGYNVAPFTNTGTWVEGYEIRLLNVAGAKPNIKKL